jgi:hypothetical protein
MASHPPPNAFAMSGPSDTDPDSARVQLDLLRAAGPSRRASLAIGLTRTVIDLSRRALRSARPELPEAEIEALWVEIHYGREIAEGLREYRRRRPGP